MNAASSTPPPHRDAQSLRLFTALTSLIANGQVVIGIAELAKRSQVTPHLAKVAIEDWLRQGWLRVAPDDHATSSYLVTDRCPTAPNAAAIDARAILQVISVDYVELGLLTYGYGTALAFHDLSQLVQREIYVFHTDPSVSAPRLPPEAPFKRTTKTPTRWGTWDERPVFVSRRHPDSLRAYQRQEVPFQGITVPCTSVARTLIDCWLRPDLSGGLDRVVDAWAMYLEREATRLPALRREVATILRDSTWPSMRRAFIPWLAQQHDAFTADHVDWRGLLDG